MANNRYFLHCPICHDTYYFGKSLGDGIYHNTPDDSAMLQPMYEFMWEHLLSCQPEGEWTKGTPFDVLTEYSEEMVLKDHKFVHSNYQDGNN